jgi:toxin CptA
MELEMDAKGRELKYSDGAVELRLAPSPLGAWLVFAAALASLAVIAATPGLDGARILAATWVACGALEAVHSRALLRGQRGVRALRVRGNAIEIEDGLGRWRKGAIRAGSFVAPWLTIVRWRPEGARFDRTIAILPGMAGAEEFRRLRVELKWS